MPATQLQRLRVLGRTWLPWRKLLGHRTVCREVQGVKLYMPWSHVLPDYARARPSYGQNLVEVAAALAARQEGPLRFVDVGANIGDSTLQILHRMNARALCVEADPYWARYLRLNVGTNERVAIEEVLLTPADQGWEEVAPQRRLGTTHFAPAEGEDGFRRVSATALRAAHADFAAARLIKSDTDGFDTLLVPALAEAWRDSSPVLFFEFDPGLTRRVTGGDPQALWPTLEGLGYDHLAVWDNTGDPLGRLCVADAAAYARRLESDRHPGYQFWDVCAWRRDDAIAEAALEKVLAADFDPLYNDDWIKSAQRVATIR